MKFTTRDRDHDCWPHNCAIPAQHSGISGGWWYQTCSDIFPNNQHNRKYGILLNGQYHSLPFVEMKIRPKNCTMSYH